jgi:hypothetical protein
MVVPGSGVRGLDIGMCTVKRKAIGLYRLGAKLTFLRVRTITRPDIGISNVKTFGGRMFRYQKLRHKLFGPMRHSASPTLPNTVSLIYSVLTCSRSSRYHKRLPILRQM